MKSLYKNVPESIKRILRKTEFYKKRNIRKKVIVKNSEINHILDEAPALLLEKKFLKFPHVGIIKSQNNNLVEGYVNPKASWLRYERFCKNNNIPYDFLDIKKSNWIQKAEKFDIIVCHTESSPAYQEMMESKIYILEKLMGKTCFPSFHELWQYENKNRANYLYQYLNLPLIPTIVTNCKDEAIEIAKNAHYPIITKTKIGSSSKGVEKIRNEYQLNRNIKRIFSRKGQKTYFPYLRQKDYLYVQSFIDDAHFDLRIMLVGNMAFGYYRYPRKNDFRASGSGHTEKKEIPREALLLAIEVRQKLKSRQMGVDLLFSPKTKQYLIIETSIFNQIDTPVQFALDGIPGYYDISDVNNIKFKKGKYWVQEIMIRDLILEWIKQKTIVDSREISN